MNDRLEEVEWRRLASLVAGDMELARSIHADDHELISPGGRPSGLMPRERAPLNPTPDPTGFGGIRPPAAYLAYSTARVSRMTVTLIWPG